MAFTRPGTYVLYRERGGVQPPWPGITIPDDIAPQHIHQERPSGYTSLTLLFGTTYRFRWAMTSQLSPFVPIPDDAQHTLPPELLQAFQMADFGLDACLSIDYWRQEVANLFGDESILGQGAKPDPNCINLDSADDEEELNDDLREAMRISLEECQSKRPNMFLTPSSSPSARGLKRRRPHFIEISDEETDDDHDSLYSSPSKTISPPLRMGNSVLGKAKIDSIARTSSTKIDNTGSATEVTTSQSRSAVPRSFEQLLRGQNSTAPRSDNIEGDITESRDFVRIVVGPDHEVHTLLKAHLWERPYFRDFRSGLNRFILKDDDMYELEHPELPKLDPTDFQFLAEYLTDGDFGLRSPEGPEQTKEAIAQCVSAWEAADKLGMFDLLEHIVDKVKFLEWDNADMLILAVIVYRTPDQPTAAHEDMKTWIADYLAHHFWTYVRDETMGHLFRRRLKAIPALEREVFERRAAILVAGAELSEDEGSDGDGL